MLTCTTMQRGIAFILLLLFFISTKSGGDSESYGDSIVNRIDFQQQQEAQQIDSFIKALHNRGLFNGTLLVARRGDVVYHQSMGVANRITGDTITNDMPYQMASVSKPITASAIMLLVQRGEISPEDKITKYFPELMQFNKVKIKHLLTHTSGIPDYIYRLQLEWEKQKHDYYMSNEDLVSFYSTKKYRCMYTPGYRYDYSNTNYALLASIVERVTEQRFSDFVKAEIFDPLGMCNTHVFNPATDSANGPTPILGYRWTGRSWLEYGTDYRNGIAGDKGVYSTADDMMRFSKGFDADHLWCNETCNDIFKTTYTRGRGESEYGYGWRMREWDSMPVVLHYGFWNSFRTGLIEFPESDVTFVILNNFTGSSGGSVNNRDLIIRELMKIMFPDEPILLQQAKVEDHNDEGTETEGGGEPTDETPADSTGD